MNFPFGTPITLINRIPVDQADAYGDDVVIPADETVLGGFDPGGGSEKGDTVDTRPTVFLPPGSTLTFLSAVKVDGVTYEVDDVPQQWNSPFTGERFGVRVPLKAQQRRPA